MGAADNKILANRTRIRGMLSIAGRVGPLIGYSSAILTSLTLLDYFKEALTVSSNKVGQGEFGDNVGRRM